jgi:hypothetical protein
LLVFAIGFIHPAAVACSYLIRRLIGVVSDEDLLLTVSAGGFEELRGGAAVSESLG